MIKNERQYHLTKAQAEKLTNAVDELTGQPVEDTQIHPLIHKAQIDGLKSQLADLHEQMEEFEALRSGKHAVSISDLAAIEEVPRVLIQARIASGLSHKDLAQRLGLKEQQIQRYEATDYASASLTRVKEVIDALDIKVDDQLLPKGAQASVESLFKRLRSVGLDHKLVTKRLLPSSLVEQMQNGGKGEIAEKLGIQAAASIGRVFGWTPAQIFGSSPLQLGAASLGGVRFKTASRVSETHTNAYTFYAHYLAMILGDAISATPSVAIPTDAREFRNAVESSYGTITFENVLRHAWELGIPVIPLSDPGAFHGACWRIDGRNVIVLKQRTGSVSRWLYDLLHELSHAGQEPKNRDFNWIDEEDMSLDRREATDEQAANLFAGDVILDGRAEELAKLCVEAARGRVELLKSIVPGIASREGVPVDGLANYLAYRLSLQDINWWGTATNLQETNSNPWQIARDVFLENMPLQNINEFDRNLLIQALADTEV